MERSKTAEEGGGDAQKKKRPREEEEEEEEKKRPKRAEEEADSRIKAEIAKRRAAVAKHREKILQIRREKTEEKTAVKKKIAKLQKKLDAFKRRKSAACEKEKVATRREESALETAVKALTAAKAQTPAAVEASGHFAMLSDFEILEILRCFVPSSDQAHVFDVRQICAVAATCRRLHALAFSPEIWRGFYPGVIHRSIKDSTLRKLCAAPWLSACERLRVHLSSSSPKIALVERVPNLRELRVSSSRRIDDEDLKRLASVLSSLQHLRKLELSGSSSPDVLHFFRLEDSPVESLVLESCDSSLPIDWRVFPRITELRLVDLDEDEELIARAFPNLRKLDANGDLGAFWKHCHHLEDVDASQVSHPRIDVLATSPCSQTLRSFVASECADCTELARAAPNLVSVDLEELANIAGLAGLAHLQELVIHNETFGELNELGERARGMRLKKLTLQNCGDGGETDLTRFFGSPCCSQLEVLDVGDFSIDSCIAGLVSQSDPLPLRSFKSIGCPSNLSVLLAKCPALTDIGLEEFTAGEIAQSLGTTPSIAPVLKFIASLKTAEDLLAVGNVFGRTLQVVEFVEIKDQAAIDAFVASCPRLSSIRFGFRYKQLPHLPPWITVPQDE